MSQVIRRAVHGVIRGRGTLPRDGGLLCFENHFHAGHFVWNTILEELLQSSVPDRKILLVLVDTPPVSLKNLQLKQEQTIEIIDLYTDPEGWIQPSGLPSIITFSSLEERLLSGLQTKSFVVIDALSPVSIKISFHKVLKLLDCLKSHPNCTGILTSIYLDAHSTNELKALRSLCNGILSTALPKKVLLPLSSVKPHGALNLLQITETGRIENSIDWFQVQTSGKVHFYTPPDESQISPMGLVEVNIPQTKQKSALSGLEESLMNEMEGGMKLTMTEEERNTKQDLVLPHEKSVIPGYGEIHYERDSEEDLDSDEDPDDDLDI